MFSIREIGLEFVLPALIVAAGLVVGWKMGRRAGRTAGAIAFALGFAVAFSAIGGMPRWPPGSGDAAFWLVWFSAPIALLGLLDALIQPPLWLRLPISLAMFWVGLHLLLAPLKRGWSAQGISFEFCLVSLGVIGAMWWLALETEAECLRGPLMPAILGITALGAAIVFGVTQELKLMEGAMAWCVMAAAATIVAYFIPRVSMGRGAIMGFAATLFAMLAFAQFYSYSSPPLLSGLILLAAPLLAWIGELQALALRRFWRLCAHLLPVVAATAIAIALAARATSNS